VPTSLENLTLLCAHHHRLLHEGGFKIKRDTQSRLYFQRPDGRVIPRFGYRLADMRDDLEPSAEVREARGAYRVQPSARYGPIDNGPSFTTNSAPVTCPSARSMMRTREVPRSWCTS
jgi:hypothetical protein